MFTIRTKLAAIVVLALLIAGCSREQQDWRAAEAADTIEAYDQFVQRHPESELVTEARTRVAQLGEERDWREAGAVDTADAYRQFLTQHPNGKWAQEARVRIESFALSGSPAPAPASGSGSASGSAALAESGSDAALASSAVASGISAARAGPGAAGAGSGTPAPSAHGQNGAAAQLGAFNSEEAARREWRGLTGRFGPELRGLSPHIVAIDTASGRLYRLQVLVSSEDRAHVLCDSLKKRGQGCMTVQTR
ncbi:MAG TPA: SPOR domain-containing protein [Steroidobacteraceae bacterium]|nr:SPOR domain-containing protein [Steroidobacteraceae bacterium]